MNSGDLALLIAMVFSIWFLVFRAWVIDDLNRLWKQKEIK